MVQISEYFYYRESEFSAHFVCLRLEFFIMSFSPFFIGRADIYAFLFSFVAMLNEHRGSAHTHPAFQTCSAAHGEFGPIAHGSFLA
jgi:hypothetical protein